MNEFNRLQNIISEACISLSHLYGDSKNEKLAEQTLLIANFILPNRVETFTELSSLYYRNLDVEKSLSFAKKAVDLTHESNQFCLLNAAIIAADSGLTDVALNYYDKALQVDKNCLKAKFGLAVEKLKKRNYKEGWAEYLIRHQAFEVDNDIKKLNKIPRWNGEDNGNLVIYNEQGYGDLIFGLRYLQFINTQQNKFSIKVDANMEPFLKTTKYAAYINKRNFKAKYKCSILDLPALLHKDKFYSDFYSEVFLQWNKKPQKQKKIALVFSGSPQYNADTRRSMCLSNFKLLEDMPNFKFYIFNKNMKDNPYCDVKMGANTYVDKLTDFCVSANYLKKMDGLITVDTAMAHIGGALGIPTFVLLNKNCDFRWWSSNTKTPWYRSWYIFKQKKLGCWSEPIKRLKKHLISHLH